MLALGDGAPGRWLGRERTALANQLVLGKTPRLPCGSRHLGVQRAGGRLNQESFAKHRTCRHLDLNLPASRAARRKLLCSVLQQPGRAQTLVSQTHAAHTPQPTGTGSRASTRLEGKESLSEHLPAVGLPHSRPQRGRSRVSAATTLPGGPGAGE